MLASNPRSVGRRFAGAAVTLALTLSLPLGAVALAAPPMVPPPPEAKPEAKPDAKADTKADAKPDAKKEPAALPGLTVLLPIEVAGSMSKDSRRTLADRLQRAAAAAKVSGSHRVRLSVRVSKKKDYALTLTVLGADDATLASPSDECKACSIAQVGDRIDALVEQAVGSLAPKEPPPPEPAGVSVRTEPLGARVVVDGIERGLSPQTVELPPGEHTIAVDKPGFVAQQQTITVEPGTPQELALTLAAQPPAGKGKKGRAKDKGAKPSTTAGRGLTIGGGVMLGLGIAGVATGVAMILIDEDPMPLRCSDADLDFRGVCRYRYDTLLGGIVGVAAGAVGIGGGLAMMIKGRQLAVRARAGKQAASLSLTLRF